MFTTEPSIDEMVATLGGCVSKEPRASQPCLRIWDVPTDLWNHITTIACDKKGCRVLQAALDDGDSCCRLAIAHTFHGKVWEAILSENANHVLQRIIELVPPTSVLFILSEIECGCGTVFAAKHRFGCRVCERVLEHFPHSLLTRFTDDIVSHTLDLCAHAYGTFVVQHLFEHGGMEQRDKMVQTLLPCMQSAASNENVVGALDSAMCYASMEMRHNIVAAMRECDGLLEKLIHKRRGYGLVMRMVYTSMLPADCMPSASMQRRKKQHLVHASTEKPLTSKVHSKWTIAVESVSG